jgi:cyanophycin synthetase
VTPPPVELVELRVLDGPNLYFPRPALKLTLAVPGWLRATEGTVSRAAEKLDLSGVAELPGAPATEQRRRAAARIAGRLASRIASGTGVTRLAVRARPGSEPGEIVVAFPWRHRRAAEALGHATVEAMQEVLRRSPTRVVAELADRVRDVEPGPEPQVPDPEVPVIQVTGTNGKTTTVRLLAHIFATAGRHVAYSSTDGVYRGERRVRKGDYSGFGGAAMALAQHPDVAVLETARGGILLRGIGVLHNDVAVVTNVSADHLDLHGIHTVDQLAEVKATITRITRPGGWSVLNADDPRVWAMRRAATGRPWAFSLDPNHPAIREALAAGGRATTVIDGTLAWMRGSAVHPLVRLLDVPLTLAGISSVNAANAMAAASAALAVGLGPRAVAKGLRSFVPDPERNPGRANLFELDGRVIVIDYAHNEAGMIGLTEILRGVRDRGSKIWLAICTAGDRTDRILKAFAFQAAVGSDHLAVADLRHYLRGRSIDGLYSILCEAAAEAGVTDVPHHRGELQALKQMVAASARGDVIGVTALGMRPQIFRWLAGEGASQLGPADVRRHVRRTSSRRPRTS